jgi:hypothetical protein
MAEGKETSPIASDAIPVSVIAKPGDLHPAITEMIEGPRVESPTIQPGIGEPPQPELPLTIATAPTPVASATTAPAEASRTETPGIEPKIPSDATQDEIEFSSVTPPTFLRDHARRIIAAKPAPKAKAPREAARPSKFLLLAASVAICASFGAAIGSVGIASLAPAPTAPAGTPAAAVADVKALRDLVAQLGADVAATRSNVEHLNRTSGAQFGKLVERFDKSDRAQLDPATKLAKITETLDRLEKRVAALPVTPPPAPVAANPPAGDVTGSITPRNGPDAKAPPPKQPTILESFTLRRVYGGTAYIEGRMGVIQVEPGETLPGGGRVEEIKRQDGRWVVVTTKGLIVSQRDR